MRTWSSVRTALLVFLAALLGGIAAAAADTAATSADYAAQLATAKALAAEKSWAKAQVAYVAAFALAPDAEAKRWCELGRVDAGWREAGGNAGTEALLVRIGEFENLLERYQTPGTEKDAFWFAAMESWADFRVGRDLGAHGAGRLFEEVEYQNQRNRSKMTGIPERRVSRFLDLASPPDAERLAICDALGEQLPTLEARQRYLEAVRELVGEPQRQWDRTVLGRLIEQVRMASRLAVSTDDRAWFALVAQLLTAPQADTNAAKAAQWRTVLEQVKNTKWEALAAGAEFCWRAASGWIPERATGTPIDLVACVRECDALLGRLWPELQLDLSLDEVDWADGAKVESLVGVAKHGWVTPVVLALGNWRNQWQEPRLELSLPSQVKPGESVGGYYGATAVDAVEFTLARLTPEEWLQHERFRQTSGKLGKEPTGEVLRRWSVATDLAAQLGYRSGTVELGATLPSGFYLVMAEGRANERVTRSSQRFLVTGVEVALLSAYFKPAELHCLDSETRRPVQGATIVGAAAERYSDTAAASLPASTDADGRAVLRFSDEVGAMRSDRIAGWVGGQPFVSDWKGQLGFDRESMIEGDVIFDREVYRPGETVRWKLVLRDYRAGRYEIPAVGTKLKVSSEIGDRVLVKEVECSLNAFGTVAGEVALPESLAPGYGFLRFSFVGETKQRISTTSSSTGFRVEFYRPPATKAVVELAGSPESLRPGRETSFRVTALYLSGGPMAGVEVRGQITFERSHFAEEEPGHAADLKRSGVTLPKPRACLATTDESGAAVVRCALPADLPEGTMVMLKGSVLPAGVAEVKFDQTFHVTKTGYQYVPMHDGRVDAVLLGTEVQFGAQVYYGDRSAAVFSGTAQIVECRWNEAWRLPSGQIVMGDEAAKLGLSAKRDDSDFDADATAAGRPECLHSGYEETVVAEMPVQTDAQGKVEVRHTPQRSGLYRLRLMQDGIELFTSAASRSMTIVCDEDTTELALPRIGTIVAVLGPVVNGAPLRVLVVLPKTQKRGWLLVTGADRAVAQPFEVQGTIGILKVENPPRFDARGCVKVEWPGARYGGGRAEFEVVVKDSALHVAIEPNAVESRPGSEAQLHLNVSGGIGAVQPTELCVGVVDEAVATLGRPADWRRQTAFAKRDHDSAYLILADKGSMKAFVPMDERCGIVVADRWWELRWEEYERGASLEALSRLGPGSWFAEPMNTIGLANGYWGMPLSQTRSLPSIRLRTRFDATAFWAPQVVTDAKGEATVSFKYPDNLTQWRIEAYAVGADGNSFGTATAFTRTSLPFQARLNLPRFLVAGDRAAPSATLVNRTDGALTASAELAVGGAVAVEEPMKMARGGIVVPKQGEAHAGWAVRAEKSGTTEFTLKSWAGAESDGMVLKLPVLEDGILQQTAASGRLARGETKRELALGLPEPFDPARTSVRVLVTGSHAAVMLDALPYLVDYPYGCVEQTLSRFLPAVVAKRTLGELGLAVASVEARILGQETAADAQRRAKTAGLGRLDEVIEKSLARLSEAQRHDGGFGWWPQASQTDLWMTAYTAWGLELACRAGVAVPEKMTERTNSALMAALAEKSPDRDLPGRADGRAWALAAVANVRLGEREAKQRAEAWAQCYAVRGNLTPAGRACLALAAAKLGTAEERAVVLRNLEKGALRVASDDLGDTVHWGATTNYWRASDGAVEATALTLLALLELEPRNALVEPAMNWLVLNRRSGHWRSTRDTAFAVLALSRFVQVRGEAQGETEVEIVAHGAAVGRVKLNRETLLTGPTVVNVPVTKLRAGSNRIELSRVSGDGPVYAVALAESWAAGDSVKPAGHQAEVARGFVRQKATPTLIGTLRIVPEVLPSGSAAIAGEEVQAVVTVTVPNELEYVMIEVPKPAGCEPLNPLSGWDARIRRVVTDDATLRQAPAAAGAAEQAGRAIYREERDEKSVFFLDRLEAGTWAIRFGMRAVTAGDFRALPVQVEAMYVPEIRANSDAQRVRIEPRE